MLEVRGRGIPREAADQQNDQQQQAAEEHAITRPAWDATPRRFTARIGAKFSGVVGVALMAEPPRPS